MIAYASIYGNTQRAAELLAARLADSGVKNIAMYDTSVTHPSYILAECFRYSHIVFASPTYNSGIFPTMETLLNDIKAHGLQNRTVAFMENGTWAAQTAKQMREILSTLKNINILENTVSIKSSIKPEQSECIDVLVKELCGTL